MAPIDSAEFVVIGMAGKTPERFVEAVPADATKAYIVSRDENDTCAQQAEAARKTLATRERPVRVEIVPCKIYDPIACFALVDRLLRQEAGARARVVIGTGTNVFAAAAFQAAGTHAAEVINVTEDKGEGRIRHDKLDLLPPEPEDDLLIALNVVAAQRNGLITGRGLQRQLAKLGRPALKPSEMSEADDPGAGQTQMGRQRRGVRAHRFVLDTVLRRSVLDTPPARDIPFDELDRTYRLSDLGKRIVGAYGHRFPREKWSVDGEAEAPLPKPPRARRRRL